MEKDTKIVIGAIVVILALIFIFNVGITGNPIIPSSPITSTTNRCTDSDGGKNFDVKGTCKSRTGQIFNDVCEGVSIKEFYCDGVNRNCIYQLSICPVGKMCLNGACVITCTNDCSPSGTKQCSGTNAYKTCGNYDTDSCLEWSSATNCATGQTCSNGACVVCTPKTCSQLGKTCGSQSDTCGGTLNCGTCSTGYTCTDGNCIATTCSDGTAYGRCSTTQPKYCDNGNLIDKCSYCGCYRLPSTPYCWNDGSCKSTNMTG